MDKRIGFCFLGYWKEDVLFFLESREAIKLKLILKQMV